MSSNTTIPSKFRCRGCNHLEAATRQGDVWLVRCSAAGAEVEPPRKKEVPFYFGCKHRPDFVPQYVINPDCKRGTVLACSIVPSRNPLSPDELQRLAASVRRRKDELCAMVDSGFSDSREESLTAYIASTEAEIRESGRI